VKRRQAAKKKQEPNENRRKIGLICDILLTLNCH